MLNLNYDPLVGYEAPRLVMPVSGRDHTQGAESAPVTLVEYGDYQCPYCGQAYPVIKQLQEDLGSQMRYAYRHFPLTQAHPMAMRAAQAAEAAGLQGKFWEMHDTLFENQDVLTPSSILRWAGDLGLDVGQFEGDLGRKDVAYHIREDRRSGIRSGVNGTPTFFINGRRYDGPPSYEGLNQALAEENL